MRVIGNLKRIASRRSSLGFQSKSADGNSGHATASDTDSDGPINEISSPRRSLGSKQQSERWGLLSSPTKRTTGRPTLGRRSSVSGRLGRDTGDEASSSPSKSPRKIMARQQSERMSTTIPRRNSTSMTSAAFQRQHSLRQVHTSDHRESLVAKPLYTILPHGAPASPRKTAPNMDLPLAVSPRKQPVLAPLPLASPNKKTPSAIPRLNPPRLDSLSSSSHHHKKKETQERTLPSRRASLDLHFSQHSKRDLMTSSWHCIGTSVAGSSVDDSAELQSINTKESKESEGSTFTSTGWSLASADQKKFLNRLPHVTAHGGAGGIGSQLYTQKRPSISLVSLDSDCDSSDADSDSFG